MNNIGEQINQIINNLSEKLGVAASQLYPVLIKQAYVDGIRNLIFMIISIVILYFTIRMFVNSIKNPDLVSRWNSTDYFEWSGKQYARFFISIPIIIIFSIILTCSFNRALTAFINPNYYAIYEIMSYLK